VLYRISRGLQPPEKVPSQKGFSPGP
jgi:hypothetical protein